MKLKLTQEGQKWLDGLGDTMIAGTLASLFDLWISPAGEFHWKLILTFMGWNYKSYVKDHPRPKLIEIVTTTTTKNDITGEMKAVVVKVVKEDLRAGLPAPEGVPLKRATDFIEPIVRPVEPPQ